MLEVHIIRTLDDLNGVGTAYDELLRSAGRVRCHYLRAWMGNCLRPWAYGSARGQPESSMRCLAVYDNDTMVGFAPLQLETKPRSRFRLRRLHFLGDNPASLLHARPDFLIHPRTDRRACISALLEYLSATTSFNWDLLDLRMIRADSPNLEVLKRLYPDSTLEDEPLNSALIDLRNGLDPYISALSKNFKQDLNKRRNRLKRHGICAEFLYEPSLTESNRGDFENLHMKRQACLQKKGIARHSCFEDPVEGPAIRELFSWADRNDSVRYVSLELDGRLAAACINIACETTLYWIITAMDDDFAEYAPAKLLMMHLLECADAENRFECVDLGPGINQVKRQLATRIVEHVRWSLGRPGIMSKIRRRLFSGGKRLRGLGARALARD